MLPKIMIILATVRRTRWNIITRSPSPFLP
jgi:hypothetical protein